MKAVVGIVATVAIAVIAPALAPGVLALLGTSTATALALSVTTAIIGAALAVGVGIAFKALGITAGAPKTSAGPPTIFRQSVSDSFIVYGRRRVGGLLVFYHPRKVGKKHYRYYVIACAGHRCAGNPQFRLNDTIVTVDGSHKVTSGPYANAAWLWFDRGEDDSAANATFVAECGGKWTANHRGRGIAKIYAKFEMTDAVVQAGMPNITADIDGKDDIADPRDDSTGFTDNATLVFYDFMRVAREEGGFGAYADEIPDDDWISAQANVCDETVDGEARYTLNGVITTGAPPSDIRDVLVVNCAGTYTYSEGKHLMRPGYYVPPSVTLHEDDIAAPIQVSPFLSGDQTANEVSGNYINPADGYQAAAFPAQTTTPAPGDIRQLSLDLAFVTSVKRAQRIARIMLRRALHDKTVTWPSNIAGLAVKALDTVQLGTSRYGLSNYAWTVQGWGLAPDFSIVSSLREEDPDIYSDDEVTVPDTTPALAEAEPVLTSAELVSLISTSFTTDADPPDGLLQGTDDEITIEAHTRTYDDKTVSVTGDTVTGLTAETLYHIYYDDEERAGGAVTFVATTDSQEAATTPANPARHYVGSLMTDVVDGEGTSGGGASPPGWDPGNYCVTIDALILMEDGTEKPAGEIAVGDLIRTRHELTLEWGAWRVSHVSFVPSDDVWSFGGLNATGDHRIWLGGWVRMREIGERAAPATVAKITVEEAHTYVSNGLLSHNIKQWFEPDV